MVADGIFESRKKNSEVKKPEVRQAIKLSEIVIFDYDSSVIRKDQGPVIKDIAKYTEDYPETLLVIKGYASEEGPESYNLKLSERRANSVKDALMEEGVEPTKIKSVTGEGETTMFGELLDTNRRVIVVTVGE